MSVGILEKAIVAFNYVASLILL